MQVTVANHAPLRTSVTISYTIAEVQARRGQVLRQLGSEIKLDGFRPGKGAMGVVEKRYGAAATQRTEELLLDEGLQQALRDNKLKPVGQFTQDGLERTDGLKLITSFEVKPPVVLPEFSTLKINKSEVEVTDAQVDESLTALARRAGDMGGLAEGETVREDDNLTLAGTVTVGGVEARKLHDFHHLVGAYPLFGKEPAGVVEVFKAAKVGSEVRFTATLPASFTPAEHAGKEAEIAVTVQNVQRLRAAPLDDALAKKMGIDNLEVLRGLMRERMKQTKLGEQRQAQGKELLDGLLASVTVELPPTLTAAVKKTQADAAAERATNQKKTDAEIAAARAEAETAAEQMLKRSFVLDAVAEKLNVAVTREDLEDQIRLAAGQTGRKPEDIAKQLQESGQVNQVAQEIREAKALETLLDTVLSPA